MKLAFTVNGMKRELVVDSRVSLVDLLRDELELTGAKVGCGAGNCGSCTVLLNGHAVYACLILAVECDGDAIVTIEGLARDDRLDPIQEAFIASDAMQCGFCTPGQVLSVKGLQNQLAEGRMETADLKLELAGNLCRCGAYRNIQDAAQRVLGTALAADRTSLK